MSYADRGSSLLYSKRSRHEKAWMLLILTAALALRLFVLFTEGDRMFLGTDDDNYRESAEILLDTGVLTYGGWKEPTVFIMPGYPILLAGIFSLVGSTSWLAVRVFQVLLSLTQVWFGARLGFHLGGRSTGLLTAALLALYPPNLTAPSFLLTEVTFTCALLAALLSFLKAEEMGRVKWFALTGLALGLATYFRPTSGLLPVVFAGYLLIRRYPLRKIIYGTLIMGMIVAACLSPWITRNYILYREFIPFTVSGGNPFLRGTYINGEINEKFPWIKGDRSLSDRAQMEYGKERVVKGFQNDFGGYLYWYTVGKFTDLWAAPYYYKELTYLPAQQVNLVHRIILGAGLGGLVIGLWQFKRAALLFLSIIAYFTFVHLVYLSGPRYSYPVVQLVIILGAYFVAAAAGAIRRLLLKR